MSIPTQSTAETYLKNLANLEGTLSQTSPLSDKAFLRVLAALEAGNHTELVKFATERALQNLALTATGEDLVAIGVNLGVFPKPAEAAVLTIELPATNGTIIQATNNFVGDSNGIRYGVDAAATAAAGVAVISITARVLGESGNLNVSETLTIETAVPGAENVATVTVVDNLGVSAEAEEAYRLRVLDEQRTNGGGGNTADYRSWAQEVAGVFRDYPYSAGPIGSTSKPPQRTNYVEAATAIDPDGIAPQAMLDEVRDSITADPDTGIARQPLGLTDETLFVESITRAELFYEVRGLTVPEQLETTVKSDIGIALEIYSRAIKPFVDGLDSLLDRNDLITDPAVSSVAQAVVSAAGGSITGVGFGFSVGTFTPQYRLKQGETAKSGGVVYA